MQASSTTAVRSAPIPVAQHPGARRRAGKVLLMFVVLLPALLAFAGLVIDGGVLLNGYRRAQHATDAAATAAARSLAAGSSPTTAADVAEQFVTQHNGLSAANVTVNIPPLSGPYAGQAKCAEVVVRDQPETHFAGFVGSGAVSQVQSRAVAGMRPATAGAGIVVLDPHPPQLSVPALPNILPALPALVGGLELEGLGTVRVDGAVLVNTEWSGQDENGNAVGEGPSPPWAIASLNLLSPGRLRARDIRVVGGVDNPAYYAHYTSGQPTSLSAGRLPVPDPLIDVPAPTVAADPVNVVNVNRGGVRITGLIISPWQDLDPGVYDWIEVASGKARFRPGVYVIRGTNPVTGIALNILAGQVHAEGVLFYLTNSATYSAATGMPDAADGESTPPAPAVLTLLPSAVINLLLPGNSISGLNDPASPFHGLLIYQRRADRRPIAIVTGLLGGDSISGRVYAKWGHVILAANGTIDGSFVAGTMRIVTVLNTTIAPQSLLPPAEDVFLLE